MILLAFSSCSKEKTPLKSRNAKNSSLVSKKYDNEIFDMDVIITNKGVVTQTIKAGYVGQTKIEYSNFMRNDIDSGLCVSFYKNGKLSGKLTSNKGIMDDKKGTFVAIGNVVFKSPSGYTVYTEELQWNRKKGRIFTDKYVLSVSDKKDTLIGEHGIDSDQNFADIIVKSAKGKTKVNQKTKLYEENKGF